MVTDNQRTAASNFTAVSRNGHEFAPNENEPPPPSTVARTDAAAPGSHLVEEPIYLLTVAVFALITTGLPTVLGQFRFMPIIQALALAVFLGIALRHARLRACLRILGIWLLVQFGTLTVLTIVLPPHISERAIADGFSHRQSLLEWMYAHTAYPSGLLDAPSAYLAEFAGILLGSLLSGGLIGLWFFMRLVNFTAFSVGSMTILVQGPAGLLVPLLIWNLLRIAGYFMLAPLTATPLLTGNWRFADHWTRRRLILLGLGLVIAGILAELLLTPFWPNLLSVD